MDISAFQQEIDASLTTLNAAKAYAGLGPEDPAVIALEQIMMAKVAALEAAKMKALEELQKADQPATTAEPTAAPEH